MNLKNGILLLFFHFISLLLLSQEPNDCKNAIPLSKNTLIGYNPKGPGIDDFAFPGNSRPDCDFKESSSIWLKIKIAKAGMLTMDISPSDSVDDYDFAFYKPSGNPVDACENLGKSIRCSSTNPQAAGVSAMTGLRDSETDTSEGPGKKGNGYVKTLQVRKGEYYYILINNWSNKDGLSLGFGGTAGLDGTITCDLGSDISKSSCNREFDLNEIIREIKNRDNTLSVELFKTLSDAQNHVTKNQITGSKYTATSDSQVIYARIVNSEGCIDFKKATLTTNSVKKPKDQSFHFCNSDLNPVITLVNIPNGHTINWYDASSGGNLVHSGNDYPVAKQSKTFYVSLTNNTTGCESERAEIKVVIEPPVKKIKNQSFHFCNSDLNPVITLVNIPNGHTINWYDASSGGNLVHSGNDYPVAKQNKTFYVSLTNNTTGCESERAEIKVIIDSHPTVKIKTPYINWFYDQLVSLTATGNGLFYSWKGPDIDNNTNTEIQFTASAQKQGTYTLTGKQLSACESNDKVTLKMYNKVKDELGEDFYLCSGETQTLSYPNIKGFKYDWSTGESSNAITISNAGTYTLTVTTPNGNTNTGAVQVKLSDIQLSPIKTCFSQFIVKPTGGVAPYQYSLDGGLTWQDSPIFTKITNPGSYKITVRDAKSCMRSTQHLFMPRFVLYQAFSPNGDFINDTWDLSQLSGCNLINVEIFDRYGEYIHQMRVDNLIWDGKIHGRPIPSGTYWFNIDFNDGITPRLNTYITIKRKKD